MWLSRCLTLCRAWSSERVVEILERLATSPFTTETSTFMLSVLCLRALPLRWMSLSSTER